MSQRSRSTLDVEAICDGDSAELVLVGEVDFDTATVAASAIDAAMTHQPSRLIIDLTNVEFVDSHGLHLFVKTHHAVRATGCALSFRPPPGHVMRTFSITGLDRALTFTTVPRARGRSSVPRQRT